MCIIKLNLKKKEGRKKRRKEGRKERRKEGREGGREEGRGKGKKEERKKKRKEKAPYREDTDLPSTFTVSDCKLPGTLRDHSNPRNIQTIVPS